MLEDIKIRADFGHIRVEFYKGVPFIHVHIHTWSKSNARKCKAYEQVLITLLKIMGFKKMFSLIPKDDPFILKWNLKWGMKQVKEFENDYMMERDI